MVDSLDLSQQVAVAILAATDAVFAPSRDPLGGRHRAICQRRSAYFSTGIPWASEKVLPGLDDTGRKQVQRALDDLVARNRVVTFQPLASKTLGVRLSEDGDLHTRALAGLPTLTESLTTIEILQRETSGPHARPYLDRVWVPETALTGVAWGDDNRSQAFVELEEQLLPALVRGLVVSNCSVHGHCWYALETNQSAPTASDLNTNPTNRHEAAPREYYFRVAAELESLASARLDQERDIGDIPMPVCC